jgi:Cof subfamily protein (haloacid dehalogenase superfamily)
MPAIKLISLDVDGTLLSSSGELPSRNLEAVQAAIQKGIRVVLNTGKPPCTLKELVKVIGLRDPVSTLGGALILDVADREDWQPIHSDQLPEDLLSRLRDLIGELPLTVQINTAGDTCFFLGKEDPGYLDYFNNHYLNKNGFPSARIMDRAPWDGDYLDPATVIKVTFHSDQAEAVEVAFQRIKAIEDEIIMIGYSSPRTIDISPRTSGKREAIEFLCGLYDLTPANVMALGDYETDLDLINWAGMGAVMGNAPDFVKARAPRIAPDNDLAGVAAMIEQHVLSDPAQLG